MLPAGIAQTAMSIHILILSRLQKSLEDWLLKQTSLSFLPRRPLVLVMVALMLTLLTLASPLVSLLLLILCLPLFLQMKLEGLGQIMVKQLKNRYNDVNFFKRFVIGIDRAKMRLYDCEQSAQDDILDKGEEESIVTKSPQSRNHLRGSNFNDYFNQ